MPKLLNTTSLVTMSSATPEGLGYGNVYASSSKIYFTSSLGNFDLTDSKGYIIVREYLTGATTTWLPPANVKYVRILAVGGGGGGGGGSKRNGATPAANSSVGGTGAAGGNIVMITYPGDYFTRPSYTVTVGAGGNAGPGNTSAAGGNGTVGSNGGTTSLASGSIILIRAGVSAVAENNRGNGGNDNDNFVVGGLSNGDGCIPSNTPYVIPSWYGGHWGNLLTGNAGNPTYISNGQTPVTSADAVGTFSHAMNGQRGTAAGGAGGGIRTTASLTRAGSGSGVIVNGVISGTGSPGVAGTGNAGSDGVADLLDIMNLFYFSGSNSITSSYGLGSGGCGGASGNLTGTIGGGKGGDGADIGAGGGGGGAATGSSNAGNGGTGGDGYMAIIEYY